jgi:hypothetical protein
MKKIILLTLFGLFTCILNAQIVTDELPYGLKKNSIAMEDSVNDSKPGAIRYAYPANVNCTLENSGVQQSIERSAFLSIRQNADGTINIATCQEII